jgi:predicted nucleotidyltransferase
VYTVVDREQLRDGLLAAARADQRISGAALTGSEASGGEDEWSDIDLAFGIADADQLKQALADWTDLMYRKHGAVHHVDVVVGATVYRVFLLDNTLQVDIAFAPASEFGAIAPTFRLVFGTAVERAPQPPPSPAYLIGFGWLYALHARSSIERGKLWQAEYMVSGIRDHVLALACLRHGLPAVQGRGMDRLPAEITAPLEGALVRGLDRDEVRRAFGVAVDGLQGEIHHSDPDLAARTDGPLRELAGSTQPS